MEEIFETDRWVRDLQWAVTSPFLIHPAPATHELASCQADGCEPYSGYRVGAYFEKLIHHWLRRVRGVEVLAHGLQILEEGRTLGELDFVFRDEAGRVNHWEVAVKFYLYCADQQVAGSHFIGPNAGDTFERKRDKVFDQQLPLSEKSFPDVDVRAAFVKGRIFYHPLQADPESLPDGMAPDHLRGIWVRHSELNLLEPHGATEASAYRLAEKPHWLAPGRCRASDDLMLSFQDLKSQIGDHFSSDDRPVMLSSLVREGAWWHEADRVFVVADPWPAQAVG